MNDVQARSVAMSETRCQLLTSDSRSCPGGRDCNVVGYLHTLPMPGSRADDNARERAAVEQVRDGRRQAVRRRCDADPEHAVAEARLFECRFDELGGWRSTPADRARHVGEHFAVAPGNGREHRELSCIRPGSIEERRGKPRISAWELGNEKSLLTHQQMASDALMRAEVIMPRSPTMVR